MPTCSLGTFNCRRLIGLKGTLTPDGDRPAEKRLNFFVFLTFAGYVDVSAGLQFHFKLVISEDAVETRVAAAAAAPGGVNPQVTGEEPRTAVFVRCQSWDRRIVYIRKRPEDSQPTRARQLQGVALCEDDLRPGVDGRDVCRGWREREMAIRFFILFHHDGKFQVREMSKGW